MRLVRRSAPQITFSSTVMRPKLRTTCQVRAMPRRQTCSGRAREMSVPSSTIRPSSGWSEPLMQLKSVVLPAPLGPIRPTISRGSIVERDVAVGDQPAEALGAPLDLQQGGHRGQPFTDAGARPGSGRPSAAHGSESSPLGRQPAISMMTAP